MKRRKP
ncbi:hypothetical protein HID58_020737 [Brassica napus]|nr:hypothetical protein HID58_020737 [Brassica napus]